MTKKNEILQKALELINARGYVNIGVREIARELGISPGNLTYHFSKKDDLLIALLEQYRDSNSHLYQAYFSGVPTLANYLKLLQGIFHSQFHYRGVFIGNQFLQDKLESGEQFDYKAVYAKRVAGFKKIYQDLADAGQLQASAEDISFLVSHMTLVGRFWIFEATLLNKTPEEEPMIRHYLGLMARLVGLFATELGRESITKFWAGADADSMS